MLHHFNHATASSHDREHLSQYSSKDGEVEDQLDHVEEERCDLTYRDLALNLILGAHINDKGHAGRHGPRDEGHKAGCDASDSSSFYENVFITIHESVSLITFGGEGLDRSNVTNCFFSHL